MSNLFDSKSCVMYQNHSIISKLKKFFSAKTSQNALKTGFPKEKFFRV